MESLVNPSQVSELALVPSAMAKWETAIREYIAKLQGVDPMADLGMGRALSRAMSAARRAS